MSYDPSFEYAEGLDQELMAEQEEMLANPAPFEAEIAAGPLAAEEGLEESEFMSYDNQTDFNSDFNAEEATDSAITDLGTGPLGINVPDTGLDPSLLENPGFDL